MYEIILVTLCHLNPVSLQTCSECPDGRARTGLMKIVCDLKTGVVCRFFVCLFFTTFR